MNTTETKICTKCKQEKELNQFSFRNDTQNYRRQCKQCVSYTSKKYYIENIDKIKQYQDENKTKIKERKKAKYLSNCEEIKQKRKQYCKDNPDKIKEQKRKYYLKNQDKIKAKTREYYFNNIEDIKIKSKEYRKNNFEKLKKAKQKYVKENPEKVKERHRRYMQTEKGKLIAKNMKHSRRDKYKKGDVTTEQIKELYKNTKNCYWCNCKLEKNNTHLDHYIPLSKDGKHTISNLVLACGSCNRKKSSKDPLKFAQEIGKLL